MPHLNKNNQPHIMREGQKEKKKKGAQIQTKPNQTKPKGRHKNVI